MAWSCPQVLLALCGELLAGLGDYEPWVIHTSEMNSAIADVQQQHVALKWKHAQIREIN